MDLTLHVISYKNLPPSNDLSVTINQTTCNIGRAAVNDFELPDVERIISHKHAVIKFENGAYYLTDNSTNGTYINHAQEAIGQGNEIILNNGDVLSIGEYDCAVSIETQKSQVSNSFQDNALLQPPVHSEHQAQGAILGDSFLHSSPSQSQEKKPGFGQVPYLEPETPITPPSSDGQASGIEQEYFQPPNPIPENWNELTGINLKKETITPQLIPEPINQPEIAPTNNAVNEQYAASPEIKSQKNVNNISNLNQQAVDAFLAGIGLTQVQLEPEAITGFMQTAGQVVREITQGFRQVLETRTNLKGEFRLEMTSMRPTENNPLKFSIDVTDSLNKLLFPPKGYLPPVQAIQEATDDLQAHQMALLAGLRAALNSLVALFDPEALEKEFQKASTVDNLLPSIKKAKCWDAFKTRYSHAAADAENVFLRFLGDEFTIAYEQQIKRLKNTRQN